MTINKLSLLALGACFLTSSQVIHASESSSWFKTFTDAGRTALNSMNIFRRGDTSSLFRQLPSLSDKEKIAEKAAFTAGIKTGSSLLTTPKMGPVVFQLKGYSQGQQTLVKKSVPKDVSSKTGTALSKDVFEAIKALSLEKIQTPVAVVPMLSSTQIGDDVHFDEISFEEAIIPALAESTVQSVALQPMVCSAAYPVAAIIPSCTLIGDGLYLDENGEIQPIETEPATQYITLMGNGLYCDEQGVGHSFDEQEIDISDLSNEYYEELDAHMAKNIVLEDDQDDEQETDSELDINENIIEDASELNLGGYFKEQGCVVDEEECNRLENTVQKITVTDFDDDQDFIQELNQAVEEYALEHLKVTSRVTF